MLIRCAAAEAHMIPFSEEHHARESAHRIKRLDYLYNNMHVSRLHDLVSFPASKANMYAEQMADTTEASIRRKI